MGISLKREMKSDEQRVPYPALLLSLRYVEPLFSFLNTAFTLVHICEGAVHSHAAKPL